MKRDQTLYAIFLRNARSPRHGRFAPLLFVLALCTADASLAAAQPIPPLPPPPSAPAAPAAPEARLEGRSLAVKTPDGARMVPLPCEGRALLLSADRAYVACGVGGVVVVRLGPDAPAIEAILAVAGEAVGLFTVGERVWVETTQTTAQPVDQLGGGTVPAASALAVPSPAQPSETDAMPPPPPPPRPMEPPPEHLGRVVRIEEGTVVIDMGRTQGLSIGSRIALGAPPTGARDLDDLLDERVTVGEVVAVGESSARVRLGFGEVVAEGASARRVSTPVTRQRLAPPRIVGWSVGFMVRTMLSLDLEGFLVEGDVSVQYRGERSYFLRAELDPLAGAVGEGPETGAFAARVLGGYDHRIFALGLGFGAAHAEYETFDDFGFFDLERSVRPTIEQYVRIGALDGLHAYATNSFGRGDNGFGWVQVLAGLQIPAGPRTWLIFRGGGGSTRFDWGEVALRHMIRGNGARGSLFITAAAGGGALEPADFFVSYAGPYIGVGLEWRL